MLVPGPAVAQDLRSFDWTGFYAGARVGVVQSAGRSVPTYPAGGAPLAGTGFGFSGGDLYFNGGLQDAGLPTLFTLNSDGSVGGVDLGYNVQGGPVVVGIEGDLASLVGAEAAQTRASPSGQTNVGVTANIDALATARIRTGVAVDRLMFFATAGLAVGHTSLSSDLHYDNGKSATASGATDGWSLGGVAGLGAEYALNNRISLNAEGLYYRLAPQTVTATGSGVSGGAATTLQPYSVTNSPSGLIVRGGINVHF